MKYLIQKKKQLINFQKNNIVKANKLKVKSKTENLSIIRDFVNSYAVDAGVAPDIIDNIILAVDEACTNIIKHAYHSVPDGEIIIKIELSDKKFNVAITDYGNSFSPEKIPKPDLQKYYKQKKVGGLGMYLMKTLMDEVEYRSVPGKYNEVLLSKSIKMGKSNVR